MKAVCLLSGGIDSPVAAHMMLSQGADVILLHMDNRPFIDDRPMKKVNDLVKTLSKLHKTKLKLILAEHGPTQASIVKNCPKKMTCVLCRRMMLKVAEAVAKKEDAEALITGENLGQVASQTLDNLRAEEGAVSLPILRPIVGFDKEDTIKIAREIGTFETSTLPGHCCGLAPQYPETHADVEELKRAENKLDVDKLVKDSVKSMKSITIG